MAAGVVILHEAGGKVTDFKGASHSIYGRELVASNGRIHPAMLDLLQEDSTPS
jgi:myo-inositol-1(or 4)-monophosphatase